MPSLHIVTRNGSKAYQSPSEGWHTLHNINTGFQMNNAGIMPAKRKQMCLRFASVLPESV